MRNREDIMGKIVQHIFTKQNVDKYFLSPYASVKLDEDTLYVGNSHCSEEAYIVDNQNNWAVEMIQQLKNGIDEEQLKQMIYENTGEDAEDWIAFFIQGGIIE